MSQSSNWFLEQVNQFIVPTMPPHLLHVKTIEHIWDEVEYEIHIVDVHLSIMDIYITYRRG